MLNDWQTAVRAEIITAENPDWNGDKLKRILKATFKTCAAWCMAKNRGKIFMALSGGLDSSFCLAVTRLMFPQTAIETITTGGNYNHPDIRHARIISSLFRTSHHEFVPDKKELAAATKEYTKAFGYNPKSNGDLAVFSVFHFFRKAGAKAAITHDGIDELLGGYWPHRANCGPHQEDAFRDLWKRLVPEHLEPLQRSADHFGIKLLLPYLQLPVVKYIAGIPVDQRTTKEVSKIPLRNIARKYLPSEIIERKKMGFCSGLDKF